jgi:hypothetical protein
MPDSSDYRKYLDLQFSTLTDHFLEVRYELGIIKEQTIKTNGRVTSAEKDIQNLVTSGIKHAVDCPALKEIGDIDKGLTTVDEKVDKVISDLDEYRFFKRHPILGIIIIMVGMFLVLSSIFQVFKKVSFSQDAKIDNIEMQNEFVQLKASIDSLKVLIIKDMKK